MPALALLKEVAHRGSGLRVLDACAAPGGKFLLLAGALFNSENGLADCLVAVERDKFRFNRFCQNLGLYLPRRVLKNVHTVMGDATLLASSSSPLRSLGLNDAAFDAILVDAPCSSERERLMRGGPEVQRVFSAASTPETRAAALARVLWEPMKVQSNKRRQVELLRASLGAAPHGHVVYSTCALSAVENDNVVGEVLATDHPGWTCELGTEDNCGLESYIEPEAGKYGRQILPDKGGGWGPIYWSVLRSPETNKA